MAWVKYHPNRHTITEIEKSHIDWVRHVIVVVSEVATPAHVAVVQMLLILRIIVTLLGKRNQCCPRDVGCTQYPKLCGFSLTPSLAVCHSL